MSFCATCGRPRAGTAPYCRGCGAEFSDAPDTLVQAAETTGGAVAPAGAEAPDSGLTRWDTGWYRPGAGGPAGAAAGAAGPPGGLDPWATAQPTETYGPGSSAQGSSGPGPWAQAPSGQGAWGQGAYGQGAYGAGQYGQGAWGQGAYGAVPGGAGTSGARQPGRRRGGTGILIAVVVVAVLAVGGGAFAVVSAITGHKTAPQPSSPASTGPSQPASSASAPASAPASSAPAASATPAPVAVSAAPGVAANPAAPAVESLLDRYFTAINTHDYAAYSSLLDAQMQESQSSFDSGYATTKDSAETLTGITDTGGGGLAATVSFTSRQNPADSIYHSSCTVWTITLYLQPHGSGYLIGVPPASYQPAHQDCP